MRTTIQDKVAQGTVSEQDAQVVYNALDGIRDGDMFAQFLKVKEDFYL